MDRIIATIFAFIFGVVMYEVAALAPIPTRPPGFTYNNGSTSAPVQITAFIDLICPDSKAAWPTYKKVADYYGPEKVRLSSVLFPLPYHRAAIHDAQATFIVQMLDSSKVMDWFDTAFDNQETLADTVIFEKPESYIITTLTSWATTLGLSEDQFLTHLKRSDPTQQLARVEFKYGGTRGIYATPTSFVNGVMINADPTWTLENWKEVIDPLLQ